MAATVETSAIREHEALAEVSKEWAALHQDAAPGSPFEHPAWAEAWARHYVRRGSLECIAVRDRDMDGSLIGFAPLYRRQCSAGGLSATCIQPLGTRSGEALTEVVQVLARPERTREVLRAVVRHLEALGGWNWAQLSLNPNQGWLVPQWLDDHANALIKHRKARPCVIFADLPADVDALGRTLKRNVRESIRRSRNRAAKLGGMTLRCASDVSEVEASVPELVRLHQMRARMPGKTEHPDICGGVDGAFLVEAATNLAQESLARVHLAEHDGEPVAALLVLSDGNADYVSVSGLNPRYWDLSLNTMLIFQALTEAIARKRTSVNLSTGPDIAKTRWSSTVAAYHDFAIVRPDRKSRWTYAAFSHASLALDNRQEARRHRVLGDSRPNRTRVRPGSAVRS
ncbi:MAG: GNAT family N-acetyltransferase [Mycobacteriaceae bacterium]|nr:GNAT family N-acetyltransferase [Mycobacteriaceae bacterium]